MNTHIDTRAPIDRALAQANLAKSRSNPAPDLGAVREAKRRQIEEPSLDTKVVKLDDSPMAEEVNRLLGQVHETWIQLRDVSSDENYTVRDLAPIGKAAVKNMHNAIDRAIERANTAFMLHDKNIDKAVVVKIDPATQAEMRSFLRDNPSQVGRLIKSSPQWASAVLSAPRELSGIKKNEQFLNIRQIAEQHWAPEEFAARKMAMKAADHLRNVKAKIEAKVAPKVSDWNLPDSPAMTALRGGAG